MYVKAQINERWQLNEVQRRWHKGHFAKLMWHEEHCTFSTCWGQIENKETAQNEKHIPSGFNQTCRLKNIPIKKIKQKTWRNKTHFACIFKWYKWEFLDLRTQPTSTAWTTQIVDFPLSKSEHWWEECSFDNSEMFALAQFNFYGHSGTSTDFDPAFTHC